MWSVWQNRLKEALLLASMPVILLATLYMLVALFWLIVIALAALAKITGILLLPVIYTLLPTWLWDTFNLTPIKQLPPGELLILNLEKGWPDGAWHFMHEAAVRAMDASWPYLLGIALLWLFFGYRYQRQWGAVAFGLDVLPEGAAPWVEEDILELSTWAEMPPPRLSIWAMEAPNAFASGLDHNTYKITVTTGLLTTLSRDEIRAVLAHELGHIKAGDVRLLTLCYVFGGIFNATADYLWLNVSHSLRGENTVYNRLFFSIPFVMLFALVLNFAGGIAKLLRFGMVRGREFQADQFAVMLTDDAPALHSALSQIAAYKAPPPKVRIVHESLIHRPMRHWWQRWTATHPAMELRLKALRQKQKLLK